MHTEEHHDEGHHGGHGPQSSEEAKEIHKKLGNVPRKMLGSKMGVKKLVSLSSLLSLESGRRSQAYWTSTKLKSTILDCAKELNRFRYCEDNYASRTGDPSETVDDDSYPCTEEQWQATECLAEEHPDTPDEILTFTEDVNNAGSFLRKISSHIQIPREWYQVIHECDPMGMTSPSYLNPFKFRHRMGSEANERALNCIAKSLFPQEVDDFTRSCKHSFDFNQTNPNSRCSIAINNLTSSLNALQLSRFNIRDDEDNAVFRDVDTQKGNKINKWKKANVVGGDPALRKIEVHPAEHWISLVPSLRKKSKFDWVPEIAAKVASSSEDVEDSEESKEGVEEGQ